MPFGMDFGVLNAQTRPDATPFLMSAELDVELSVPPALCLSACCYTSHNDDNGLNL